MVASIDLLIEILENNNGHHLLGTYKNLIYTQ